MTWKEFTCNSGGIVVALCVLLMPAAHAAPRHHGGRSKMVAYDAKDKRFYSVAWAKAHGMHDKGGDPLTIVPRACLPKEAKESKAMRGAKI